MEYVSDVDSLTITVGRGYGSLEVHRDDVGAWSESFSQIVLAFSPSSDDARESQSIEWGPVWLNVDVTSAGADFAMPIQQAIELRDHLTHLIDTGYIDDPDHP